MGRHNGYFSKGSKLIFIFPLASVSLSFLIWSFAPINLLPSSFNGLISKHNSNIKTYAFLNHTEDWIFGDFSIRNSNHCSHAILTTIVLLVHSDPANLDNRNLLRRYTPSNYCLTFLLGSRDNETNQQVAKESKQFGDIVQGTFHDSYRNLTRKHIMGLTWAALYCPLAPFIFKTDDDVFLNFTAIGDYLETRFPSSSMDPFLVRSPVKMIVGYVMPRPPVIRDKTSKWYVNSVEYKDGFYPTFVSGWGYITTIDVINQLLNQIKVTSLFWIDDIYVTGMLRSKSSDIFFHSINKYFNIELSILHNWTKLNYDHVWPYMISVSSKDLLAPSYQRYDFCYHRKSSCYCCVPWLDLFNEKKSSALAYPDLVPLKTHGMVAEVQLG